jgi:hypothetical protein
MNAADPMVVMWSGMVTLSRLEQLINVRSGIEVKPWPIVTCVRLRQSDNAELPREMTLLGIVRLVRPERANALTPMFVTPSGIIRFVTEVAPQKAAAPMQTIGRLLIVLGIVTSPLEPLYPVTVSVPLFVVKLN